MHKIAATLLPILMIMAPFAHAQETTTEAPLLSASALGETLPAEASPATDAAGAPESAGEPAPQDAVPPVDAPAAGGSAGDTQPADSEGPAPALEDVSSGADSSTPIQDTANTQDTVDADVLQGADNPEELATTTVAVGAAAPHRSVDLSGPAEQPVLEARRGRLAAGQHLTNFARQIAA